MGETPKVSVIIPVYNVEDYLRQALDSVVNQTLDDIEIICVDDCSTDNSLNILKEYAAKDNRIKLIVQEENQGQGVARNIALGKATGKYIMFLDPDDWLDIHACEIAYNQIYKNNNDIVFFNYRSYKETENIIVMKKSSHLYFLEDYVNKNVYLKDFENLDFHAATTWSQIYNRKFLNKINAQFSATRTCEDNPFYFNAICNAETISFTPEILYYYRLRINEEQPYYVKHWQEVFYNKEEAYEIIKNCRYKNTFLKAFIPYYWSSLVKGHLRRAIIYDKTFKNEIYKELHKLAKKLNTEYPMKSLKHDFDYDNYKLFLLTDNFILHKFLKLLFKIFSIRGNKTHKIIRIMGFKLAIKRVNANV